jgi:ribose 5-phosphate isomerase B
MNIILGSDDAGYKLKQELKTYLSKLGHNILDIGCDSENPIDYPLIAEKACETLLTHNYDRAILVCGTGIGMAICANKFPGIRGAVCHDIYSAERARKSNNAQVLALGARVIGFELAKVIVTMWLASEFTGGTSARKISEIDELDKKYRKK